MHQSARHQRRHGASRVSGTPPFLTPKVDVEKSVQFDSNSNHPPLNCSVELSIGVQLGSDFLLRRCSGRPRATASLSSNEDDDVHALNGSNMTVSDDQRNT